MTALHTCTRRIEQLAVRARGGGVKRENFLKQVRVFLSFLYQSRPATPRSAALRHAQNGSRLLAREARQMLGGALLAAVRR